MLLVQIIDWRCAYPGKIGEVVNLSGAMVSLVCSLISKIARMFQASESAMPHEIAAIDSSSRMW